MCFLLLLFIPSSGEGTSKIRIDHIKQPNHIEKQDTEQQNSKRYSFGTLSDCACPGFAGRLEEAALGFEYRAIKEVCCEIVETP